MGVEHTSAKHLLTCVPVLPADEGSFVNLQHKHNFSMAHFGMMLGMLCSSLEGEHASATEPHSVVQHCHAMHAAQTCKACSPHHRAGSICC